MKHLKKYTKFLEEAEFDVNITDSPDIKMSKEKFQTISTQLKEFKIKKPGIDNAYLKAATDSDLQFKIEQLIGKIDKLPEADRNPFLVEYLHVASLKRQVDKLQKELVNDKISKDDFTQQVNLSTEQSTKDLVIKKIVDITNRMATKNANIGTLMKDIDEAERNLNTKMTNTQKEMSEYMKRISNENVK